MIPIVLLLMLSLPVIITDVATGVATDVATGVNKIVAVVFKPI